MPCVRGRYNGKLTTYCSLHRTYFPNPQPNLEIRHKMVINMPTPHQGFLIFASPQKFDRIPDIHPQGDLLESTVAGIGELAE